LQPTDDTSTRRIATPGFWLQQFLLKLVPDEIRRKRADHIKFTRAKVAERLAKESGHDRKDFMWYIYEKQDGKDSKGDVIERDEIIVNAALLIVGGSETTATLLSGLFARLFWDMPRFSKLELEIRSAFAANDDIGFEAVSKLPYLNACLEEALRVFPPVPTGYMRRVPPGGAVIDGNFVPAGVRILAIFFFLLH
jgi:cytochrome P450